MLDYAICEIAGKQVKVVPNKEINVLLPEGVKDLEVSVLLLSEGGKLQIGKPFLKDKLKLKTLGGVSLDKIRVSKFHAKANYRKTTGIRPKAQRVILEVK